MPKRLIRRILLIKSNEEPSSFHKTQFNNDVYFLNIKGDGAINFREVRLSKDAHIIFDGLNTGSPEIIFDKCPLKEKNQVIFRNCNMSKVTVKNGTFEGFKFENCEWEPEKATGLLLFTNLYVKKAADSEIGKENFKQLEEKYASLKIAAKNSGDEQLASEFHFWQLYYADKVLDKPIPKIINWFYYQLCGYGLSITRPIISLLLLSFLSSLIYSLILNNNLCIPLLEQCKWDFQPVNFYLSKGHWNFDAIKLSIEASTFSFDPFKLMEDPVCELNKVCEPNKISELNQIKIAAFYFLQKSISLFLLFEFGQAIRNKVKK